MDLTPILRMLQIGGFIIVILTIYSLYSIFKSEVIITNKRIEPELIITTKDNKTDTLYIYKN